MCFVKCVVHCFYTRWSFSGSCVACVSARGRTESGEYIAAYDWIIWCVVISLVCINKRAYIGACVLMAVCCVLFVVLHGKSIALKMLRFGVPLVDVKVFIRNQGEGYDLAYVQTHMLMVRRAVLSVTQGLIHISSRYTFILNILLCHNSRSLSIT